MKSSPHHRPPRPVSKDGIALFAALLSIVVTSWINSFWALNAGAAAVTVCVLIGIFTYKLGTWLTTFRQIGRKNERN